MIGNVLGLIVMALVALAFGWLTWRVRRVQNGFLKWGGLMLGGLLTLVVFAIFLVTLNGLRKFYAARGVAIPEISVAATPEQIQRGEHLANTFCASCHSLDNNLPLSGGMDLGQDFPINLGKYVASNLTPAGSLAEWSDGEIFRAIRNGIDRTGRGLVIMSNVRGRNLSDEDTLAVIAYLRSQPPVENKTPDPSDQPNLMAILMSGAGMIPDAPPPITGPLSAPLKGATVAYGEYIFSYQDCRDCHGEDLQGGVQGQLAPIGPSLEGVRTWTSEQYITAMRTGATPYGYTMSEVMPWQNIGRMDDDELEAMYLYLTSLP